MAHLGVAILGVFTAARSFAASYTWTDAKSGREFQLLGTEMTWDQAYAACKAQGYALSDLRFLGDDERKDFLAGAGMAKLGWEKLYAGTSRETQVAHLWQSARAGTLAGGVSYGSTQVVIQKRGDQTTTAEEWHGEDDTAQGICMSTPAFWYTCSVHFKCTYKYTGGQYSISTSYVDFGTTANEAMHHITDRTDDPSATGDGECLLETDSRICLRELP